MVPSGEGQITPPLGVTCRHGLDGIELFVELDRELASGADVEGWLRTFKLFLDAQPRGQLRGKKLSLANNSLSDHHAQAILGVCAEAGLDFAVLLPLSLP